MRSDVESGERESRASIIGAVKTPLGFFVLAALVAEGVLVLVVATAKGTERTVLIVGMIVLLLAALLLVFLLARRRTDPLGEAEAKPRLESKSFDVIAARISSTIDRLESRSYDLARCYKSRGDLQRLLDGLYSGLLYASGAVPTGFMSQHYYGNLMEVDQTGESLRVRYFKGPYNDEIICRTFPLRGPGQGVAGEAVKTGEIQCRNSMEIELKEKGESLLKAMVSIPVRGSDGETSHPGNIVVINVDGYFEGTFPESGSAEMESMNTRARELAQLVERVNKLRSELS